MTGMYRCFDAAFPPMAAPAGCSAVLGYIGGGRATNVWTLQQWQRFGHLVQFPAYVPDFTTTDTPEMLAEMACTQAQDLGWAPFQADRRVIVFDLETLDERGPYARIAAECEQRGFTAVAYGSLSTVLANAASDVWAAAWDGTPALLPGQTVHAHQYQAQVAFGGTEVDFSSIDSWLYARGGRGPRHS